MAGKLGHAHRRPGPRRVTVGIATVAGVVIVGGCASTTAPEARPQASELVNRTAPNMLDLSGQHLPIERYLLTSRQMVDLNAARLHLAAGCLARYGLAAPELVAAARSFSGTSISEGETTAANTSRRYGIMDAAVAARLGYHLPGLSASATKLRPEPKLSPEVTLVLTGETNNATSLNTGKSTGPRDGIVYRRKPVPDGGCMGEADLQLGAQAGSIGDAQLANDINQKSLEQTMTEPATAKVMKEWSACMKTAGLTYDDPLHTPGTPIDENKPATPKEVSTATTDVACKRQTNIVGYWFTAEQAYQTLAIRDHNGEFEQIRRQLETMTSRAAAVLTRENRVTEHGTTVPRPSVSTAR